MAAHNYQEGDIILCTVTNIVRTTVFVETEDKTKGSIVFSEIAPGRIRNIRDYVVPKKVIACKILNVKDNYLFLSLRRVKTNEQNELLQQYKKEKSFKSILKKICGENAEEIIEKIKQESSLIEFFDKAREELKKLEKYFNQSQIEYLKKVLSEKKEKEKEIKKEFKLSCNQPDGIKIIKLILLPHKGIFYLGNSKFVIKIKSADLKRASKEINKILEIIEKKAKKHKCEFEVKK